MSPSKLEYNLNRKMKLIIIMAATLLILGNSIKCDQGSVANFQEVCITPRYIEGCYQYLSSDYCKICNYRYILLTNGLCSLNTSPNQDCCSKRGSKGECITCQKGLYLIQGKCQESNILGCLEKDNSGVCINCAADYYLKNGKCVKAIKNCISYTDAAKTICNDCAKDFSLINNICVKNSILGCKRQEDKTCKECFKPFILKNGGCQINDCKFYDEYKCVACECGYYLTFEGQCKIMETGCVRYSRGKCADCLPKFRLKGDKCEIEGCLNLSGLSCSTCDESYNLVNGACLMKNCLSWKDGSCETCKPGYHYKLGKCLASASVMSE